MGGVPPPGAARRANPSGRPPTSSGRNHDRSRPTRCTADATPPSTDQPNAWESVPKFIRFMVWVAAILAFLSTIGGVIFGLIFGLVFLAALGA